ncbi:LapA family protein [Corynebacterium terpenotabidum]|uniref:Lipopolysaccharide assembly protein A domain-containing protein n=1 Tax=Corynebacterium terpenotabidum Y-11 TaxID=1200352 RepID=S4XD07_9CORY|nr:lipopolysaccharide assembly protein LapA domain-containing protein [Corynebacterium terpenotabidum]AGP31012.1 hypothetical protein A606_06825 [Corynebacterium terpenotabidum Y-11]
MRNKDADLTGDDGAAGVDATAAETAMETAAETAPEGSAAGQASTPAPTVVPAENGSADVTVTDAPAGAEDHSITRSAAGSTWVALIIGAVILILLLVFILQNGDSVQLKMFIWEWNFPIGVGMLIAAVGGALVTASVGTVRIMQLRRQVKTRS